MENKISQKLTNAELTKKDDKYYITLTYQKSTKDKVIEIKTDPIKLPLSDYLDSYYSNITMGYDVFASDNYIDFGLGKIRVPKSFELHETVLEEKIYEMTQEDIERQLGYKIKIV